MTILNGIKRILPKSVKHQIKRALGIAALEEHVARLERDLTSIKTFFSPMLMKMEGLVMDEELWEKTRTRWRESAPNCGLTWGMEINGHPFIKKLQEYIAFSEEKNILEIGPGYGRLLKSCLVFQVPFQQYVTLDISEKTTAFLKAQFPEQQYCFLRGDVENFVFTERFDIVFSSLTFKHLFPSFSNALVNLAKYMNTGGIIAFDLLEGDSRVIEDDQVTYVRAYQQQEVLDILYMTPLEWMAFDHVTHAPNMKRLLVIARKK